MVHLPSRGTPARPSVHAGSLHVTDLLVHEREERAWASLSPFSWVGEKRLSFREGCLSLFFGERRGRNLQMFWREKREDWMDELITLSTGFRKTPRG